MQLNVNKQSIKISELTCIVICQNKNLLYKLYFHIFMITIKHSMYNACNFVYTKQICPRLISHFLNK